MAWITKDTAGAKVETREDPYLTEDMKRELTERYLPRFETSLGALLPALHLIQHEYGWVPEQAMLEIAEFLQVKPSDVIDTATFYEEYWTEPKGQHTIAICRSIACEFCDHQKLTDACREKLGIEVGETTDDGRFTLIELECLGSCGTAPVALVDETLHENLTPDQLTRLVDEAKDAPAH